MSGGGSGLQAAAAEWGVELPEEVTGPTVFKVWPDNWEAVLMFLRLQTQWRHGSRGPAGLDLSVAAWLFSLYQVQSPLQMLEDLQIMESAYLVELYS